MDPETSFLTGLIELQYGQKVEDKLKKISTKVPWAKDWPENKKSFWNAEAFMWNYKIKKEKRDLIARELSFLKEKNSNKNLDLGCGAYSYIPSVGLDISEKMLQFNDNCKEKVIADLEDVLPLKNDSFDSVTTVFVLNYVENYVRLLSEIKRILKDKGSFVAVLYSKKLNDWQRQKEINKFSSEEWKDVFEKAGFSVEFYEKGDLWFYRCRKSNLEK